jgi:hypothetical protein
MTQSKYKQIEIEIREMIQEVRNGRNSIYGIATRCVALLNDSKNYAAEIGIQERAVVVHLDGFFRDFAINLETALELLKVFPHQSQWDRPLLFLLEEARYKCLQQKKENAAPQLKVRRQETGAELDAVKIPSTSKQADVAEAINEPQPINELTELREENKRLAIENKNLRKQLAETRAKLKRITRARNAARLSLS